MRISGLLLPPSAAASRSLLSGRLGARLREEGSSSRAIATFIPCHSSFVHSECTVPAVVCSAAGCCCCCCSTLSTTTSNSSSFTSQQPCSLLIPPTADARPARPATAVVILRRPILRCVHRFFRLSCLLCYQSVVGGHVVECDERCQGYGRSHSGCGARRVEQVVQACIAAAGH